MTAEISVNPLAVTLLREGGSNATAFTSHQCYLIATLYDDSWRVKHTGRPSTGFVNCRRRGAGG